MKAGTILVATAMCLSSCAEADLGPDPVGAPTTQDLAMASSETGEQVPRSDSYGGICATFDRHLDELIADPAASVLLDVLTGESDGDDPLLHVNDGPFGVAWHGLMTEFVGPDTSDRRPLVKTDDELAELNRLSAQQCGYPVFSAITAIMCASGSDCEAPTDPRPEYRRLQQTADRIDAYFEAKGSDWLSEIPGERIAELKWNGEVSEVLIRLDESQVPELGLWIAAFTEANDFDFDSSSLRDPAFWDQVPHRATNLSLAVVGGLFGVYESPTNRDGMMLSVRALPSPQLDSSRGDDAQDLYLIGSELQTGTLTAEEMLLTYQDLTPDESLVLIAVS